MGTNYSIPKIMAALALMAFTLPLPAFSQMGAMEHFDTMGSMMGSCMEHAEKLGLTDDQMAKMKPGHNALYKKQVQFKADQKLAEIELMEIMDVKDFDLEKATAAVNKIEKIQTVYRVELLKSMKEMRTELTDAQFKKMQKMMTMKPGDRKSLKRTNKKLHATGKLEEKTK